MLGLLVIGLTVFMIYTLVKNALFGKQISSGDQFTGTIDLILPIVHSTQNVAASWSQSLSQYRGTGLRIHVLVDGHHPEIESWNDLSRNHAFVEVQSFLTRPDNVSAVPWMIKQIAHRMQGEVVMIADPELIPSADLFSSLAKIVKDKDRVYLTLPQTEKKNVLGEAVALLNPALAMTSFYGFQKFRRTLSHPFLSLTDGWLALPVTSFKDLPLDDLRGSSWKLSFVKALENKGQKVYLAFGEKHLKRMYPEFFEDYFKAMQETWGVLWAKEDKKSFWFFIVILFVWSFPFICFFTHPFWAIASLFLLVLYRFFSKIVFQESWLAVALHPVACLTWITSLFWWAGTSARQKSGTLKKY